MNAESTNLNAIEIQLLRREVDALRDELLGWKMYAETLNTIIAQKDEALKSATEFPVPPRGASV